ncbi:flagellar basal body P-ring formation chaperone FlgA [Roseomonas sp. GC11]|uniref:flagellar basal body P-ring formation chaperone FlgA n=1 Tax=Roseomonas sp. GC11 TaxID=2950546 RepID=UPI00210E3E8A|nr:flagellar basal body P-ring formation chaperone FlgA [Roseomonas sp. GC11]MCQ4161693.1 flagellar basal body P-ring formation chaperone FlgA [Roseomonas sp. GC11]
MLRLRTLLATALLLAGPAAAREVWHATRSLSPGDILRPEDIEPQTPRREQPGMVSAERDIVGMEVKRRVRGLVALSERDIGERAAVRSTQMIRVFWKREGMTLELEGRAMESGAVGEEIRVHNPQSGRTIRAMVVADGTAEVRGAP